MKEKETNTALAVIGGFSIILFSPIWNGFVISKLALWFFAHQVSIPVAIGAALLVQVLRPIPYMCKDDRDGNTKIQHALGTCFLAPAFALGVGFVVSRFI